MVNHGLVVVPAFLIVAMISERTGSEELGPMGGLAKKAPVFAVIFLIVSMATPAIPRLGQLHRRVLHPQRALPG